MRWDKQADTADATLGKLHPAGSLVALMTSWKPMILRLCIINKWSPAPEDVEDNASVTMNKYDQNLAQDAVFEKLFKDPKTGLMADGISLVPAD